MYSNDQIQLLLKNKHVIKCSKINIGYTTDFKLMAIKQYYEKGYSPAIIFKEAGFNLDITEIIF